MKIMTATITTAAYIILAFANPASAGQVSWELVDNGKPCFCQAEVKLSWNGGMASGNWSGTASVPDNVREVKVAVTRDGQTKTYVRKIGQNVKVKLKL